MAKDRWIIASTGATEGSGEPTHYIMELEAKDGVYEPMASVYAIAGARLLIEALYWQEALQNGVMVAPPATVKAVAAKAKRASRVKAGARPRRNP